MARGRSRKTRLTRMDAAVDAMKPYGFLEVTVVKVAKQLLKEYGGEDAWPFIELDAYQQLIEALLRVPENGDEEGPESANHSKDMSIEDGEIGASSRLSDPRHSENRTENAQADVPSTSEVVSSSSATNHEAGEISAPAGEGEKAWKNIAQQTANVPIENNGSDPKTTDPPGWSASIRGSSSLMNIPSSSQINMRAPSPSNSLPTQRRRNPCFGWIESDEEDPYDFILLPSSGVSPFTPSQNLYTRLSIRMISERKRKSRWDETPAHPL